MIENRDFATQVIDRSDTSKYYSTAPTVEPTAITEGTQWLSPQTQFMVEPSIELPTSDFRNKNNRKTDLQTGCRKLGITFISTSSNIHPTEMITEESRPPSNDIIPDGRYAPSSPFHSQPTPHRVTKTLSSNTTQQANLGHDRVDMLDIVRKIETVMSKLKARDIEIDLLNTETKIDFDGLLDL